MNKTPAAAAAPIVSEPVTFEVYGFRYRTNADASVVEANDAGTWNRTGSLRVREAALAALAARSAS